MAIDTNTSNATVQIIDTVSQHLKDYHYLKEYVPVEVLTDGAITVDTTYVIPNRSQHGDMNAYNQCTFQVHIIDKMFEKLADQHIEDPTNDLDHPDKNKLNSIHKVTALMRVIYYHAEPVRDSNDIQRNAWFVSGAVTDAVDSIDWDIVQQQTTLPTGVGSGGGEHAFVEECFIARADVLDKSYGLSRNLIPIRHLFSIVYYEDTHVTFQEER